MILLPEAKKIRFSHFLPALLLLFSCPASARDDKGEGSTHSACSELLFSNTDASSHVQGMDLPFEALELPQVWKMNTSNPIKLEEFQWLFDAEGMEISFASVDQAEILADALQVIAHKASAFSGEGIPVLVEDTSLEVEGADIGINIRWFEDRLDEYIGRRAVWRSFLAYRQGDHVFIFIGEVEGMLVPPPEGEAVKMDSVFQPLTQSEPLLMIERNSLEVLTQVSARARAALKLFQGHVSAVMPVIESWDGPWQEKE
jgi:inosine/xanthosine triphosphate pyrophosphatase family protein